jgi:3-deoxy-manno-octulosonate cytidylyltransferase (CMP-KDO synthetase)
MTNLPPCYGIIPARYRSARFPGKPLVDIRGKPMFWHVYQRALRCQDLARVVLATDDKRIFSAAQALEVPVLMTRSDHPSGTDRVLEAAELLNVAQDSVILNIQGDEPVLEPLMLNELLGPFSSPRTMVTTLVRKAPPAKAESPDVVTVTFARNGRALYFSRSVIPYPRQGLIDTVYEQIGMYGFRMRALKEFVALGPSRLEKIEKLEQLRLLENDIPIQIVVTEYASHDVDRPEDLEVVNRILSQMQNKLRG